MEKSPDFVDQDRACSIFNDFVGRLFVYRTTDFVYVAMVTVHNTVISYLLPIRQFKFSFVDAPLHNITRLAVRRRLLTMSDIAAA